MNLKSDFAYLAMYLGSFFIVFILVNIYFDDRFIDGLECSSEDKKSYYSILIIIPYFILSVVAFAHVAGK